MNKLNELLAQVETEFQRVARHATEAISTDEAIRIAAKAVQMYDETHPRPPHVNQTQAANMLCISTASVSRLIKAGSLSLNGVGMIPVGQIDRIIEARKIAA